MPTWYWVVTAILCFNASVIFATSRSRLLFFVGLGIGAWGMALAGVGALVWLVT